MSLAVIALVTTLYALGRWWLPLSIGLPEYLTGKTEVDPGKAITLSALGIGASLTSVVLENDQGMHLEQSMNRRSLEFRNVLEYGKHYTLKVQAQRSWLHQRLEKTVSFDTPVLPKIETTLNPQLDAEGRLEIRFSDPVGQLQGEGGPPLEISSDPDRKIFSIKLIGADHLQGKRFPITLNWETPQGTRLPAFELEVSTAPPLTANLGIEGMKNLGLAMPAELSFSEPLLNREKALDSLRVTANGSQEVEGKWIWYGKQKVQFRPEPGWPAHARIEVEIRPGPARSIQGGTLSAPFKAQFETGSDRRIEVFLDRQRVEVFENGEKIRTLRASTGKSKTPTVTGSFYIYARFPKKTMKSTGLRPGEKGYYEVKDVPYAQYFHEGYAFHGAFWHNAFGQPASHGCINLATQQKNARQGINEDAGWLYQWASLGVPVVVHGQSPPKEPASAAREPASP